VTVPLLGVPSDLDRLEALRRQASRKLDWQAQRAARYRAYYDGEQPVPAMLGSEERQHFRAFLALAGANWAELIVNAVAERLDVVGFRFGGSTERAWLIWQASGMDADGEMVQTDALVTGSAPVSIQPDEGNPTGVTITAEAPEQACVLYDPAAPRRRVAGYKRFRDATPDDEQPVDATEILVTAEWVVTWDGEQRRTGAPADVQPNPAGTVNMVEIVPHPRTLGAPRSELKPVLPLQDRINVTLFNRLVGADYGAFRQIWATGLRMAREVISEAEDGEPVTRPVKPFDIGADRLLVNEKEGGRFGAIAGDSLAGYLAAVEQDVKMLAAITSTPAHYLLGDMVNMSADAIKAAEAGLVKKVARRARHIGEGWEEVVRVALGIVGDPGAVDVQGETQWADFEVRSMGQLVDALVKLATIAVPTEVLWEKYGASPQDIRRWRRMARAEEARSVQPTAAPGAAPGAAPAPGAQPAAAPASAG
jgi:hypothetical protein